MSNHARTAHEAHLSEAIRGWQLGLNPNRPPHHRRRRRPVGSAARRGNSPGAAAAGPGARPPPAMGGRGAAPRCARPRLSGIDARARDLGSARGAAPAARLPGGAAALPQEHEAWPRHKRSPLAARGSPGARGSRGPGGERAGAALGGAGATAPTAQRGAATARARGPLAARAGPPVAWARGPGSGPSLGARPAAARRARPRHGGPAPAARATGARARDPVARVRPGSPTPRWLSQPAQPMCGRSHGQARASDSGEGTAPVSRGHSAPASAGAAP